MDAATRERLRTLPGAPRPDRLRRLTAPWRCLPDFLIIGAQKSGTTSLYRWLERHANVVTGPWKECSFFDAERRTTAGYRACFPLRRTRRQVEVATGGPVRVGEATPYYLFQPDVPRRVAALLPDARLIALLRDPVERAYSHYRHNVALGIETLSFEDAIDAEPERTGRGPDDGFRHFSSDPSGAMDEVTSFLGLPREPDRPYDVHNRGEDGPPMAHATRDGLRRRFAAADRDLEALLGIELPWPRA
jgi:hypothetical protein